MPSTLMCRIVRKPGAILLRYSIPMDPWLNICREQDLPLGAALPVQVARASAQPIAVALFKTAQGVFALHDHCPHRGGRLSAGEVEAGHVYCPVHGWPIELASGQAGLPGRGCTATIGVLVQRGEVLLNRADLDRI